MNILKELSYFFALSLMYVIAMRLMTHNFMGADVMIAIYFAYKEILKMNGG